MPSASGGTTTVCNLCGGDTWDTVEQIDGTRVVRCSCGLVFVTPRPSATELHAAYDEAYYRPWEEQGRLRERIWARRLQTIDRLVPGAGRLLDVGCGTGVFLARARRRGWTVTGTEVSAYACREAEAEGLTVHRGEAWEAGFPNDAFDVVTCWHVLEHVEDPRRLVEECHRVLRPGGWLVMATPNLHDRFFQMAYAAARGRRPRLFEANEREPHVYFFDRRTLHALVAAAAFQDVCVGFDRGAAAVWSKKMIEDLAYGWFRLTGVHWGMGLEVHARKPPRGEGGPGTIRLGIDGRELAPGRRTGIGRYVTEVLRAASQAGWTCVVYGTAETQVPAELSGVRLQRLRAPATPWWDQVTLPRRLRTDRISVFLSPYYKGPVLAPCPTVITIHDLYFIGYPGARRPVRDAARACLARLYAWRASAIIADSMFSQAAIVARLRVAAEKIRVIPIGADPRFRPVVPRKDVLARYGLSDPYLLYVGNFMPHKNLPRLLAAYARLAPDLRRRRPLVLAGGDRAARADLEQTAAGLAITEDVRFVGHVADEDLPDLYSGAALVVLPSLIEGFGLPALEAMRCGTPVAVANRAAMPEVVDDAAILFDPENVAGISTALKTVLEDGATREALARRARARGGWFSFERTTGQVLDLLRRVSGERLKGRDEAPLVPGSDDRSGLAGRGRW